MDDLFLSALSEEERGVARRAVVEHRILRLQAALGTDEVSIYVARQNADLTEGRGPYVNRGYFLIREEAERVNTALNGVMGTPNNATVDRVSVYTSADAWLAADGTHAKWLNSARGWK